MSVWNVIAWSLVGIALITDCSNILQKLHRSKLFEQMFLDMAHSVTESPFFVFGVFTVFVFGIYFSNFFEPSILRIWSV